MSSINLDGLRDYQKEPVIKAALALAKEGSRAQVLMACGTGKTHVGLRTVENVVADAGLDAPVVVLFFPNLSLLSQTARVWHGQTRLDGVVFLPV